ncbi:restriction endonuclease subunit S [Pseudoalteromonas sp. 20-MNA-CIBAN-0454]|uniref:restriction endonuclease subunit S n=1 Tax=Pseudoalteromonas sp. 20-MNA-CIBAN-0454 TaxID=3140424 RepID=UPI003320BC80
MDKTIGLACNISTGKLDANQAVSGGEYPFFTCAEFPDQIDHFAYDDDVVLVAGNNARGNFHVSRYKGKFNAYQRTYILTAKEGFNIDYVYYALKLELKRLREKSQGSQTKFLTMPILTGIHFRDITGDEQTEIANVLSVIDKKIELNNLINAELEAMAKTLYDYWFVQFDFPDANGNPYKTSGGKIVYNPTLKREIPEGWKVKKLADVTSLIRRGISPKYTDEGGISVLNQKCVRNQKISFEDARRHKIELDDEDERLLKPFDVVVNSTGVGTLGRVAYVKRLPEKKTTVDSHVSIVRAKSELLSPLYLAWKLMRHQPVIESAANGSTGQVELSKSFLEDIDVIIPSDSIVKRFEEFVTPLVPELASRESENEQLVQLRDWLLPMLMNGQVTVE